MYCLVCIQCFKFSFRDLIFALMCRPAVLRVFIQGCSKNNSFHHILLKIWQLHVCNNTMFVTTRKPFFRLRTVSLFSWTVEQNVQDTQMITRVTEGTRREKHDNLFSGCRPRFSRLHLLNPMQMSETEQ